MKWFWHNPVVDVIERGLVGLTNYVWKKRREAEKEVITKIKQQEPVLVKASEVNTPSPTPAKKPVRKRAPRSK
jgi:hypothetical protein